MNLKHIKDSIDRNTIRILYKKQMNKSSERIRELRIKHLGERVFILGNGPSLNETDFSLIKNETFFAANAFYKGMKNFNIKPQYWAIGDGGIFDNHYKKVMKLNTNLFLTHQALYNYLTCPVYKKKEPYLIETIGKIKNKTNFSFDISKGIYIGGGIIPIMIQISFYLGFKEMYLLGCDCGSKGKPSHHFYKSNRKPRDDYSEIFEIYEICKYALNFCGRRIYNATVGGNLEVFPRVKLEDIV